MLRKREKFLISAGNRNTIPQLFRRQLPHYTDCGFCQLCDRGGVGVGAQKLIKRTSKLLLVVSTMKLRRNELLTRWMRVHPQKQVSGLCQEKSDRTKIFIMSHFSPPQPSPPSPAVKFRNKCCEHNFKQSVVNIPYLISATLS